MEKKLLIAIDESRHAKNALRYAAGYNSSAGETQFTLINIQPIISEYFLEGSKSDSKMRSALDRVNFENEASSFEVLKKSKEILVEEGIANTNIKIVSQTRMLGLTKDILEYSHKHRCDAIFAGRRGLTRLQKLFMGSTSAKLMEHSRQNAAVHRRRANSPPQYPDRHRYGSNFTAHHRFCQQLFRWFIRFSLYFFPCV